MHVFGDLEMVDVGCNRLRRSGCVTRAGLIKKVAKEVLAVVSDEEVWKEVKKEVGALMRHRKSQFLGYAWPALVRLF